MVAKNFQIDGAHSFAIAYNYLTTGYHSVPTREHSAYLACPSQKRGIRPMTRNTAYANYQLVPR